MQDFEIEELTLEELEAFPELVAALESGCGSVLVCGSCSGPSEFC